MVRWLSRHWSARGGFDDLLVGALPDLWRFALRLEREPTRAEDLLQDAAARALDRAEDLREPAAFRTWMFRVILRTFQQRRNKASTRLELADDGVVALATAPTSPEHLSTDAGLGGRLSRALDALPPAWRDVVILVDAQGLSVTEAAELLGLPRSTAATWLAEARLALRNDLHDVALAHGVTR